MKITESRSATLRLSSDGQQNLSRGVKQRRQTPPFFCAHSPQRVSPHSGQKKALPAEICFLQPLHAAVSRSVHSHRKLPPYRVFAKRARKIRFFRGKRLFFQKKGKRKNGVLNAFDPCCRITCRRRGKNAPAAEKRPKTERGGRKIEKTPQNAVLFFAVMV